MYTWQWAVLAALGVSGGRLSEQIILSPSLPSPSSTSALTPDFMLSATIDDLAKGLRKGDFTSVELTRVYLQRIRSTSALNAFLFENPYALLEASEADLQLSRASAAGSVSELPPLHGIPYALKGNMAAPPHVAPNTAGSFALLSTVVNSSSTVEQRLRAQGAVLLGTTNLDEFAQAKSSFAPRGWSTLGGQMDSPFYPDGDVCGSSGGSAIATSLGLAAFTLGTQTGWSITCPASRAGVVGFKPSPGAIDRSGIVPISTHRDSVGPIARSVWDARLVYNALAVKGSDQNCKRKHWRIGVAENVSLMPAAGKALQDMLDAQSKLVNALDLLDNVEVHRINFTDYAEGELKRLAQLESKVTVSHDFRLDMEEYLSGLRDSSGLRSLEDIRDWHESHRPLSLPPGPVPPKGFRVRDTLRNGSYAMQEDIDFSVNLVEPIGYRNATYKEVTETAARDGLNKFVEPYFRTNQIDLLVSLSADGGALAQIQALIRGPMISVPLGFLPEATEVDKQWPIYPFPSMPYGIAISGLPGTDDDVLCFAETVEGVIAMSSLNGTHSWLDSSERRKRLRPDILSQLEVGHDLFRWPHTIERKE